MPLTRGAQQQREADTVRSRPNRVGFHCPDLATLDDHLARLSEQRNAPTLTTAGWQRFAEDIDALLDRRAFLVAVAQGFDVS